MAKVDNFFTVEVPQHNTLVAYISVRNEVRRAIFGKYPELVEYLIPTGMCTH